MDNLKICKTLNDVDLIISIPSKLFISTIVFYIVTIFVLKSFVFIPCLAFFTIGLLFKIYRDDPNALKLWKRAILRNYSFVQAGTINKQTKIIIKD